MSEKKSSISSLFFKFKNEEIKIIRELSGGSASSCFQIVLNNGEAYFLKKQTPFLVEGFLKGS